MAISGGIDWVEKQAALFDFVKACTGLADDHIIWADQQAPRPTQPGIIMHATIMDDNIRPWVDVEDNPLVIPTITITSVDATANTLTKTAHGLLTGDGPVVLSTTGTLPAGLNTIFYWVIRVNADTFKLAASYVDALNGVAVDFTTTGTGTLTLDDTPETVRSGEEIKFLQRSLLKVLLTLECYTDTGVGMDTATSILWRVCSKRMLPTPVAKLSDANIAIYDIGRVQSVDGTQSQYLFEPRAMLDVYLYFASEDSENTTFIERTEITREEPEPEKTWTVDGAAEAPGLGSELPFGLGG